MTTLAQLADICQISLSDAAGTTWAQATVEQWVINAIREFPIKLPRQEAIKTVAGQHKYNLPSDFVDVISVEYPYGNDPPDYLLRKSITDPAFWNSALYYDVEYDHAAGSGWEVWISADPATDEDLVVNYMAEYDYALASGDTVDLPARYFNIVILYVVWQAHIERYANILQATPLGVPDAEIIALQVKVTEAEKAYRSAVKDLLDSEIHASPTRRHPMDKFDRIY